tara:strand:- start:1599 stop:2117 length:519 start_codon:yes stop_codon:yes gene_type:complete
MKISKTPLFAALLVAGIVASNPALTTAYNANNTFNFDAQGQAITIDAFDANQNKVVTLEEVGNVYFQMLDGDNNLSLTAIEFNNNFKINMVYEEPKGYKYSKENPSEQDEPEFYTYNQFLELSKLEKFEDAYNGLNGPALIDSIFEQIDTNRNAMISLPEWNAAFIDEAELL